MAKIRRSTRKDKKWMVKSPSGKTVHAGAKGYSTTAGTKRGDSYCARSYGQTKGGKWSPNALARAMWGCIGKKSYKGKRKKIGDDY